MPTRNIIFANDQIYHIFNRGVAQLPIFHSFKHYARFLDILNYYRFTDTPTSFSQFMKLPLETRQQILESIHKENNLLVEILVFCLMPNHFHLLLRQVSEKGITTFMGNLQNSYVKYLNIKEGRVGPLFQSAFKGKRIETDEQLLHVSRYIHLNPSTSFLVETEKLVDYPWSSLPIYIDGMPKESTIVNPKPILDFFNTKDDYHNFLKDQAGYQQELAIIKHLTLE